jgi:hypothetical protein
MKNLIYALLLLTLITPCALAGEWLESSGGVEIVVDLFGFGGSTAPYATSSFNDDLDSAYSLFATTCAYNGYGAPGSNDVAEGFEPCVNNPPYVTLDQSLTNLVTDYITPTFLWNYFDYYSNQQDGFKLDISTSQDFATIFMTSGDSTSANSYWNTANASTFVPQGICFWRVKARDNPFDEWSAYSSTFTLTIDTTPPQNVQINTLTQAVSSMSVSMSGTDLLNMWFRIQYSTSPNFETAISTVSAWIYGASSGTATSVTSLVPNTTYWFEVQAKDSLYDVPGSSQAEHISAWSTTQYAKATYPDGLNVSWGVVTSSSAQVNFAPLYGVQNSPNTTYYIQVCTTPDFLSPVSSNVINGAGLSSAIISPLVPNTTYYGQIMITTVDGTTSYFYHIAIPTCTLASVPAGLYFNHPQTTNTSIDVCWSASSPDNPANTTYTVQMSTSSNFVPVQSSSVTIRAAGNAAVSGLTPNTTYYSRVIATNWLNVSTVAYVTSPSNTEVTLASIPNPQWCIPSVITNHSMTITWGASTPDNPGNTPYMVSISTISAAFPTPYYSSQTLRANGTATISGLPVNTTCYAMVTATNWAQLGATYYLVIGTATLANPPLALTISTMSWSSTYLYNLQLIINANGNPNGTEYLIVMSSAGLLSGTTIQSWTPHNDQDVVISSCLIPNTTFNYIVKARNWNWLQTAYSPQVSTVTSPSQVGAPWVTYITTTSVYWTWPSVPEAKVYNVYAGTYSATNNFITSLFPATSWFTTSLLPNTSSQIYIKAGDQYGEGMWSQSVTTYTYAATPSVPYLTNVSSGSILLTLNNAQNNSPITQYQIMCLVEGATYYVQPGAIATYLTSTPIWGNFSQFGSTAGITVRGFLSGPAALYANTTYYFSIQAENYYNETTGFSAVVSTRTTAIPPVPVLLQVSTTTIKFVTEKYDNPTSSWYSFLVTLDNGSTYWIQDNGNFNGSLGTTEFIASTTTWGGYQYYGSLATFTGYTVNVSTPADRFFKVSLRAYENNPATGGPGDVYSDLATSFSTCTLAQTPQIAELNVTTNSITMNLLNDITNQANNPAVSNSTYTAYAIKVTIADGTTRYLDPNSFTLISTMTWATLNGWQGSTITFNSLIPNMGYNISFIARNNSVPPVSSNYSTVYSTWTEMVAPSSPTISSFYNTSAQGIEITASINSIDSLSTTYAICGILNNNMYIFNGVGGWSQLPEVTNDQYGNIIPTINTTSDAYAGDYKLASVWQSTSSPKNFVVGGNIQPDNFYQIVVVAYSAARQELMVSSQSTVQTAPSQPLAPTAIPVNNQYVDVLDHLNADPNASPWLNIYASTSTDGAYAFFLGKTGVNTSGNQEFDYYVPGSTPPPVSNSWVVTSTTSLQLNWNQLSSLYPSTTLYYFATAVNNFGSESQMSSASNPASIQPVLTNYNIYFGTSAYQVINSTIPTVSVSTVTTNNILSYLFTSLTPNTSYTYQITGYSSENAEGSRALNLLNSTYTFAAIVSTAQAVTGWNNTDKYNNVISFDNNANPSYTQFAVSTLVNGTTAQIAANALISGSTSWLWLSGTGSSGATPVWQSTNTWKHTALTALTTYYYQIYSRNANSYVTSGYASTSAVTGLVGVITLGNIVCYYTSTDPRTVPSGYPTKTTAPNFVWSFASSSFPVVGCTVSWSTDPTVLPSTSTALLDPNVNMYQSSSSWSNVDLSSGTQMYYLKIRAADAQSHWSNEQDYTFYFDNDNTKPTLAQASIVPQGGQLYNGVYYGIPVNTQVNIPFNKDMSTNTFSGNIYIQSLYDNFQNSVSTTVFPTFQYSTSTKLVVAQATLNPNWTYEIIISTGVQDIVWNSLDKQYTVFFRNLISMNNTVSMVYRTENASANGITQDTTRSGIITLPPGAITEDSYAILDDNPMQSPMKVASADLNTANSKLSSRTLPVWYMEANMFDTTNQAVSSYTFANPASLVMSYSADSKTGYITGTTVKPETLSVWGFDSTKKAWLKVPSVLNKTNSQITASITHFGVYAAFGSINLSVDDVFASPVPWIPQGTDTRFISSDNGIDFNNLPQQGEIDIYTIRGELVRKIVFSGLIGGNPVTWDGKNDQGTDVASAVYIWEVKNDADKKIGKLIVIR